MTCLDSPTQRSRGWGVPRGPRRSASFSTSQRRMMWGNMSTPTAAHSCLPQVRCTFRMVSCNLHTCPFQYISDPLWKRKGKADADVLHLSLQVRRGARLPRSRGLWLLWPCKGSVTELPLRSRGLLRPKLRLLSTRSFWHSALKNSVSTVVRVWPRREPHGLPSQSPRPLLKFSQSFVLFLFLSGRDGCSVGISLLERHNLMKSYMNGDTQWWQSSALLK